MPDWPGAVSLSRDLVSLFMTGPASRCRCPGDTMHSTPCRSFTLRGQLGLNDEAIQRGFDRISPTGGRGGRIVIDDVTFIDESYNANPDSMKASIDAVLDAATHDQRIVLVLGDMLELGAETEFYHAQLGRHISDHVARFINRSRPAGGAACPGHGLRELAVGNRSHDRLAHEPDVDDAAMERIASLLVAGGHRPCRKPRVGSRRERVLEFRREMETEEARG